MKTLKRSFLNKKIIVAITVPVVLVILIAALVKGIWIYNIPEKSYSFWLFISVIIIFFELYLFSNKKFGSLTYGFLYLICIPLFAFIYYFFLPSQFYHTTSKYELYRPGVQSNGFFNEIPRKINESIIENYIACNGSHDTIINGEYFSILNLKCYFFDCSDNNYMFHFGYENSKWRDEMLTQKSNAFLFKFEYKWYKSIYKAGEYDWAYFNITTDTLMGLPFDPKLFFPQKIIQSELQEKDSLSLYTRIPKYIYKEMQTVLSTNMGFPSKKSENFFRMLYFSTVTITTLGFGDIVPLTTAARILVSLESILGVILIGLFLNSIAKENRRTV